MVGSEILIAVLLGILIFISSAYLTYFCYNRHKKLKQSGEAEGGVPEISRKGKLGLSLGLIALFAASAFSLGIKIVYRAAPAFGNQYYVSVNSPSMAAKHQSNTYLKTYGLDNQIAQYDVAVFDVYDKQDIKQYDVILFEKNNALIVHRVVEIQEDGSCITQGDNNPSRDDWSVAKSEIKGVYVKKLGFLSFVNYLGYTPGIYIALAGSVYDLGVLLLFEILDKKSEDVSSISH